jgi:hypothetical protein
MANLYWLGGNVVRAVLFERQLAFQMDDKCLVLANLTVVRA